MIIAADFGWFVTQRYKIVHDVQLIKFLAVHGEELKVGDFVALPDNRFNILPGKIPSGLDLETGNLVLF